MTTENQLRQIWQNRQYRSRRQSPPQMAGEIAQSLMDRKAWSQTAWQRHLHEVLRDGQVEGVLEEAVPLGVRDGVLEFGVASPSAACHLRMVWSAVLVELFQSRLPQAGINAVRFIPQDTA